MGIPEASSSGRTRILAIGSVLAVAAIALAGWVIYHNMHVPVEVEKPKPISARPTEERMPPPKLQFRNVTAERGIHFHHVNGATTEKLLPETMGSGVAFIDYDRDGKPDIIFINSCYWPGFEGGRPQPPAVVLYHNKGGGHFEEVPNAFGKDVVFFGMGVTVGDYDNDGYPDVFVSGVGQNRLFRNVKDDSFPGGRRFVDVTRDAGDLALSTWPAKSPGNFLKWSSPIHIGASAAWLDYDGDGLLDLFVCNYVTWSPESDTAQRIVAKDDLKTYNGPKDFKGSQCFLYRNLGGGRFEDVSEKAGIRVFDNGEPVSKALGVIVCDVDEDGWPDLIVANDQMRNFFYHNQRNGTFKEKALETGLAFAESLPRGGMGLDWGEYNPQRSGVVICNYANEPNSFFRQEGVRGLRFSDAALAEGLANPSLVPVKWSVFFFDYDLDGRLDLLSCNGNINRDVAALAGQELQAPVHLFWNCGERMTFVPVREAHSGSDIFQPILGRGGAYADIDGDGYPDIILTQNGGPAVLLHNEGGTGNHWLRLNLEGDGVRSNSSAIGARVTVQSSRTVGEKTEQRIQHRYIASSRGYLSQSELTLTLGLGADTKVDKVTIQWPGKNAGPATVLTDLAIDREHKIRQAP